MEPERSTSPGRRRRKSSLSDREQQQVLHLHHNGYGTRPIAHRLGRDRKTIQRFLSEQGVAPVRHPPSRASKLEPFHDLIAERVEKGLRTTRILREIREQGYTGGRTILNELVRSLRPPRAARVKRRFETEPGREMQVDWSVYTVPIAGRPTRVHALCCVLGYSRRVHIGFYRNERQSTLLEGLVHAFEAFDGAALRVVFDNAATVVLGRVGPRRRVLWHPRLLEFARHYGFAPFACKVRDPDRKGKDERLFLYCEEDFIRGSSFASFEELNQRARHWCDEIANRRTHGTTGRIPLQAWHEERPLLVRLPHARFAVHEDAVRQVGPTATLSIAGTPYTVPARLANRTVAVRLYAEHFEVLDADARVAFSRRYVEDALKGRLQIDPSHYAELEHRSRSGNRGRLDEHFRRRFPSLEAFVEGLARRMKSLAPVHLAALLRLASLYGEPAFLEAATRAQAYRRFSADAVRRILERSHPEQLEPELRPVGLGARAHIGLEEVDPGSLESYRQLEGDEPADDIAPDTQEEEDSDDEA